MMSTTARQTAAPRNLVPSVADRLRERVFAGAPGDRIGTLGEIAEDLGVGIVTVQQAARILEHEGLLDVRRGPAGGYYGRRPDAGTLERALAAWLRMHPDSFDEALDITSLLFIELCGAAATCVDPALHVELDAIDRQLDSCFDEDAMGRIEAELQDLLFRMVDRPIFELLTRVTLSFAALSGGPQLYQGHEGTARWVVGRRRIVRAIRGGDEALARFEADRSNRQPIRAALLASRAPDQPAA